ncbi:hypothetical protein [Deinococcus altitudinis]|uniref:hypothetical protein n=1 Tax=Deinococcus altitudinis TaxID=468914 RepID=UPI0038917A77
MRKFLPWLLFLPLLVLFTVGLAFAQTADPVAILPSFDFKAWGSSVGIFAGVLAALVSLLKARLPILTGWRVLLLAFVLSELGAFLLYSAGWLTDATYTRFTPPWVWLLFGLVGWIIASGGYNLLMQLLSARPAGITTVPVIVTAAPQVLHPIGTPGTEPLHDTDGIMIGAVKPLTPL